MIVLKAQQNILKSSLGDNLKFKFTLSDILPPLSDDYFSSKQILDCLDVIVPKIQSRKFPSKLRLIFLLALQNSKLNGELSDAWLD